MSRSFIFLLIVSAYSIFSHPVKAADDSYESLKPYLTSTTIAVLEIDAKTFLNHETMQKELQKIFKSYHPLNKNKDVKAELEQLFKSGELQTIYAIFDTSMLKRSFPFYVIPSKNKKEVQVTLESYNIFLSLKQYLRMADDVSAYQVIENQNAILACRKWDQKRIKNFKSEKRDDLLNILRKNQGSLFSLAFSPSFIQRKILEEQLPVVPGKNLNIPEGMLSKNIQGISLLMNRDITNTELLIETKNDESAGEVLSFIKKVYQNLNEGKTAKLASILNDHFVPSQNGKHLKLSIDHNSDVGKVVSQFFKPIHNLYSKEAQRKITVNRLKQIGLAMHNYYDVNSIFPARAILSKEGKPLLSWRVSILPYIEENSLYKRFHLDEPWDSEHNKKLIPLMPKTYYSPNSRINFKFKTTFQSLAGKKMFMETAKAITFQKIIDGTSNTIMIVDTSDENAMIWSKPGDYVPVENPFKGLVGHFPEGFYSLFFDGSVRFISKEVDRKIIRNLFMFNDQNVIPAF